MTLGAIHACSMSRHAGVCRQRQARVCQEKRWKMIWAVAIVLGLLWVLGVGSSHAFGGFIHVLIIAALLLGAFRFIQSRRERRAP